MTSTDRAQSPIPRPQEDANVVAARRLARAHREEQEKPTEREGDFAKHKRLTLPETDSIW